MHRLAFCISLTLLAACASQPEPTPPSAYRVAMPPPCTEDPNQPVPCTDMSGGGAPVYPDDTAYGASPGSYAPIYIAAPLVPVAAPAPPAHPAKPPVKPNPPPAKPKPGDPKHPERPCLKADKACP